MCLVISLGHALYNTVREELPYKMRACFEFYQAGDLESELGS